MMLAKAMTAAVGIMDNNGRALAMTTALFRDVRHYQIVFLLLFLFIGVWGRELAVRGDILLSAVVVSLAVQRLLDWLVPVCLAIYRYWYQPRHRHESLLTVIRLSQSYYKPGAWRSTLITALGLALLLRTDSLAAMALAATLAVASKYIFRINGKHFFNPSNFGIIMALLLTSQAWVTPGQWGQEQLYALLFLATGGLVTGKVGRWDTTVIFLLVYALAGAARNLWLGWTWDVYTHQMLNGTLLLFAFFMITDPRSIPDDRIGRTLWAGGIAILSFILQHWFFVQAAVIWALFIFSPLTILLDRWRPAIRFRWAKAGAQSQFDGAQ